MKASGAAGFPTGKVSLRRGISIGTTTKESGVMGFPMGRVSGRSRTARATRAGGARGSTTVKVS